MSELPYGLVGQFQVVPEPSPLSAPYDLHATYIDTIGDNAAQLKARIKTSFHGNITAQFDINFIPPIVQFSVMHFQKADTALLDRRTPWAKPIFKAHSSAFIFEQGLPQAQDVITCFDKAKTLVQAVRAIWQQAIGITQAATAPWQIDDHLQLNSNLVWQVTDSFQHMRLTVWQEMIRKRRQVTYAYEVAHVFERHIDLPYDNGLELIVTDAIPWDKARPTYYRKYPIEPWNPLPIPEYVGSTNLNFICPLQDIDSHNLILNFGDERCLPQLASHNWWHIMNEVNVTRLDNGEKINVLNGSFNCDRNSFCWSYQLVIPASDLYKTAPINGQPVILKIMVNGNEHHMLLENRRRSQRFAKDAYNLIGRSPSALLSPPYSPTRSFTQENERTSVQLAQAELDRVNSDITLNWQLVDSLGWILPARSMSYANSSPISAIGMLAEAGGGFIYSEPDSQTLTIKPLYKKTYWDAMDVGDYDRLIPESITIDLSTDYEPYPDYNGVWLTNERTGLTGQVKRTGTAGDVLQEAVNSPLLTTNSVMHSRGRSILAKAGLVEKHSLQLPIHPDIGLCVPGEVVAYNGDWWGIVDSVSVSFSFSKVMQTVVIERVNQDE